MRKRVNEKWECPIAFNAVIPAAHSGFEALMTFLGQFSLTQ